MYGSLFVIGAFLALIAWFIGYHVYDYLRDAKGLRRFPAFHPLAGLTNLPYMFLSYQGFRSKRLYEIHAQGNPVVRTGPNSLSYGDVRAIRDIYGHNTKCLKDGNYSVQAGSHFHLADVVDKLEHQRKRKVLSSAYALKNLEEWEFKVADKVQRMLNQFDDRCCTESETEVLDYRKWANFFSLDAIADIGLTTKLGFLDNGHDECQAMRPDGTVWRVNYRECLYANSRANSILSYSYRWYKKLIPVSKALSPYFKELWRLNEGWDGIVLNLTTERLRRYEAGERSDDFFQTLMHDKGGDPRNLEFGEIMAETSIMMNAGSTTTAIAMTNVLYWLLKNPDCLARLRKEIDSVLDEDDIVAPYEKVKFLPYLRACLDESLRIYPPTSHGLPRATPSEGAMILGEFIPGDTTVAMSAFVAHRDPEIFPEPERYDPERWLGETGKELGPYFVAFSAGARGCIGRNISYLEQTVSLASVLHRYDIELSDPDFVPDRHEWFNLHPSELSIRLRRRQESI